jgi:hypothetical protein
MFKLVKKHVQTDASSYVGLPAELTIDDDGSHFAIHDGTTPGGSPIEGGHSAATTSI